MRGLPYLPTPRWTQMIGLSSARGGMAPGLAALGVAAGSPALGDVSRHVSVPVGGVDLGSAGQTSVSLSPTRHVNLSLQPTSHRPSRSLSSPAGQHSRGACGSGRRHQNSNLMAPSLPSSTLARANSAPHLSSPNVPLARAISHQ